MVSRRPQQEHPATEPFMRVAYDLSEFTPAYNNDKWASHFHCYFSDMDVTYTHRTKGQITSIVGNFLNLIKNRFNLTVIYLRSDKERALGNEFMEIMSKYNILTEPSAPYTRI